MGKFKYLEDEIKELEALKEITLKELAEARERYHMIDRQIDRIDRELYELKKKVL